MTSDYNLLEGKFQTRDRLKLHYRFFRKNDASETLFILHGHGEHSGRYVKFAQHLQYESLSIAMLDFRGYGQSEGEHCFANHFEDYLNDFTDFFVFIEKELGVRGKVLLLGHSNGGLISVHWALRNKDKIKALFLSSPYLGLKLPPALILLNQLISRIAPHFVYSNPVYPPFLTHNPQELINYKNDVLMRRKITARLLSEMIKAHHQLAQLSVIEFPFPIMILMAGLDRVVDPAQTRRFFEKLRVPCKDLRVFEDFYHEIYNELGQEKVFEALKQQIEMARPYFAI